MIDREAATSELRDFLSNGLSQLCPAGADGQVQRVARRFLICAAAGEMAAEWGVLPWAKGEAIVAIKICFEAWLSHRGGTGAAEETAVYEQVMLFIEQHGQARFQDVEDPAPVCMNRAGFRRKTETGTGTEYYILPESFKAEVCKGHNPTLAAKVLKARGLLQPGDGRSLRRRPPVDLPGYGRKRCYAIFIDGGPQDVAD